MNKKKSNQRKHKIWFIIKIIGITFICVCFFVGISLYIIAKNSFNPDHQIIYGVTFSKKFAQQMQLDWQEAYLAVLDDLNVKYLRIPTYWEDIEPQKNQYDWSAIDWQIAEAEKRNAKVIMVVGRRQPRWPECHDPDWVELEKTDEVKKKILQNIEKVVNRYKNRQIIEMWQVENEPFLDFFGECPKIRQFELQQEIDLVKALDDRPILITDSGELSTWYPTILLGDYFGTTLYRTTWNEYVGYWEYFFMPASYYRVKALLWNKPLARTMVAELQAEPWFPKNPLDTPLPEHYRSMNKEQLIKNAEYARQTNLSRAYFWGVEWWYWLKEVQQEDDIWQAAKQFFKD